MSKVLLVGLGNPGTQYEKTRHNIGFEVAERFASFHGFHFRQQQKVAPLLRAEGIVAGKTVILVKPLTFMNRSGQAVAPLFNFYKIRPADLLVIHDDLDVPLGRLRFVRGGGAGGHNGIRSIQDLLGDRGFPRLKIGIGRPPDPRPAERYVLSRFNIEEQRAVQEILDLAVKGVVCFLEDGLDAAMNRFNGLTTAT